MDTEPTQPNSCEESGTLPYDDGTLHLPETVHESVPADGGEGMENTIDYGSVASTELDSESETTAPGHITCEDTLPDTLPDAVATAPVVETVPDHVPKYVWDDASFTRQYYMKRAVRESFPNAVGKGVAATPLKHCEHRSMLHEDIRSQWVEKRKVE